MAPTLEASRGWREANTLHRSKPRVPPAVDLTRHRTSKVNGNSTLLTCCQRYHRSSIHNIVNDHGIQQASRLQTEIHKGACS